MPCVTGAGCKSTGGSATVWCDRFKPRACRKFSENFHSVEKFRESAGQVVSRRAVPVLCRIHRFPSKLILESDWLFVPFCSTNSGAIRFDRRACLNEPAASAGGRGLSAFVLGST